MNCSPGSTKQQKLLTEILGFIGATKGLSAATVGDGAIRILQRVDRKTILLEVSALDEVLFRTDTDGREFIQVNLASGHKILMTDALIGFKPAQLKGLESSKLPRVVTTPDIVSVFEAIQDALHSAHSDEHEISVLKRVYEAVLSGGEAVGFDLSIERSWATRIPACLAKLSA